MNGFLLLAGKCEALSRLVTYSSQRIKVLINKKTFAFISVY